MPDASTQMVVCFYVRPALDWEHAQGLPKVFAQPAHGIQMRFFSWQHPQPQFQRAARTCFSDAYCSKKISFHYAA